MQTGTTISRKKNILHIKGIKALSILALVKPPLCEHSHQQTRASVSQTALCETDLAHYPLADRWFFLSAASDINALTEGLFLNALEGRREWLAHEATQIKRQA